jgi:squalene-associated FAD-dependent desaturase
MKKVVVIGSGFAGLATATFLSDAGFKVILLESSPKPGGRAYSFNDPDTGALIDNGQHILMGCYKETFRFLNLTRAAKNLTWQSSLSINFVKENFEVSKLDASGLFYPLNLLSAILHYSALSISEKFFFLKFFGKLYMYTDKELKKLTVMEWLQKENQTNNLIKSFWEILAIGALNTDINKASAKVFADILKELFFRGNNASTIVLPSTGLSEAYCNDALTFIKNKGGEVSFSEQVTGLNVLNNKVTSIITTKRTIKDFDFLISAIPLYCLNKIMLENDFLKGLSFEYSPILSVHLFLKENNFVNTFYGLIGSPVHWVFNKGTHLTIIISSAGNFIEKSKEAIIDLVSEELIKYFHFEKSNIISGIVIKERRATFIPSNNILEKRPPVNTPYTNFFLAGDWVRTGLPATIEGAVKSGKIAADAIINY